MKNGSDRNVALVDEIMQAALQTDEYFKMQLEDPALKRTGHDLESIIDGITPRITEKERDALETAINMHLNANDRVAFLYGIHTIAAIYDVAGRPCDLSKYVLEKYG
jgi:hypothetical protein